MPIAPSPKLVGQLLMQRYLILEPLASGGFSQTYLAIDTTAPDNRACVIKFMAAQPNAGMDFGHLSELFEAESYALGCLSTPGPIADGARSTPLLLGYYRDQMQVYLVQELIEGKRLDVWMESVSVPRLKDVIEILSSVLNILDQIHRQGIIHGDIKPSNLIRRQPDGKLILIDFGACRLSHAAMGIESSVDRPSRPDRAEFALGTPGYMPEEQAAGMPQLNSDIYALGMMMIQILTGIAPQTLDRYPTTRERCWHPHIRPPLRHLALIPILDRMVRIDYRDRYPTATEAIAAIQGLTRQFAASRLPLFRLQRSPFDRPSDPIAPTIGRGIQPGTASVPNAPTLAYKLMPEAAQLATHGGLT